MLAPGADAQVAGVLQINFHDDGVNQDLGQHDIQFANNDFNHLHVLVVGENEQGIGAFVGDDFGLAEQLKLSGAGGVLDNTLQILLKTAATAGGGGAQGAGP